MSPQKKRKTVVKSKAKAVAKNINKISINIGKSSQRKPKKATVVQNMPIQTSPTIYSPAPTPFYVSAPQAKPYSTFQETIAQAKRDDKEMVVAAIPPRIISTLPSSAPPSGSFVSTPSTNEFSNLEIPNTFSQQLATPTTAQKPKQQRISARQRVVNEALEMGIFVGEHDTKDQIQQKIAEKRLDQLRGMPMEMMKKDPFV